MPLPNVEGPIDHLAVDLKGERPFVAVLGNDTVEVVDLRSGAGIRSRVTRQFPESTLRPGAQSPL